MAAMMAAAPAPDEAKKPKTGFAAWRFPRHGLHR